MAQGDNIGIPLVTDATDTSNSDQYAWSQKANNTLLAAKATNADLVLKAPIASPTFTGTVTTPAIIVSSETASRVAIIDASKNVKSADTATYPSLTELAYVKGVTSAIQTQINSINTNLPVSGTGYRKFGTTTFERWYTSSSNSTALTTVTIARNNIQYMPLVVGKTCTLASVGVDITAGGTAAAVMSIAVYNSVNNLPTTLVVNCGTVLVDAIAAVKITGLSTVLTPGLYFFAINHNSVANVTMRALAVASCEPILGMALGLGATPGTFFTNTSSAYAAPADPAVTPTTVGTTTPPAVYFYLSA